MPAGHERESHEGEEVEHLLNFIPTNYVRMRFHVRCLNTWQFRSSD